ncbi:hypothetical protein [Rhizobium laguerreae]|uniref:hypothetical protein n=1 Tax=Rhizobium laguerreae TaxID=1076926 RepID=UPI001FEE0ACA|nr:hypothetical protein [Rhizobium laguerreae]
MFFTNLAKITAWLALIAGAGQLLIGFGVASEIFGPMSKRWHGMRQAPRILAT